MGYMELKGTDREVSQNLLNGILQHEDTVTMLIFGPDQGTVADIAKRIADNEPNTWWVVWVQNPLLLEESQLKRYRRKKSGEQTVVCVLSRSDNPVVFLTGALAELPNELLEAFMAAGLAD